MYIYVRANFIPPQVYAEKESCGNLPWQEVHRGRSKLKNDGECLHLSFYPPATAAATARAHTYVRYTCALYIYIRIYTARATEKSGRGSLEAITEKAPT